MMQNEGYVQKAALKFGIFDFLKTIEDEKDDAVVAKYIYLLASNLLFNIIRFNVR